VVEFSQGLDSLSACQFVALAGPPCQAVLRHPGAPGSTSVWGRDRRQVS